MYKKMDAPRQFLLHILCPYITQFVYPCQSPQVAGNWHNTFLTKAMLRQTHEAMRVLSFESKDEMLRDLCYVEIKREAEIVRKVTLMRHL